MDREFKKGRVKLVRRALLPNDLKSFVVTKIYPTKSVICEDRSLINQSEPASALNRSHVCMRHYDLMTTDYSNETLKASSSIPSFEKKRINQKEVMSSRAQTLQDVYEPRPDVQKVTGHADPSKTSLTDVDYEPHPESSLEVSPEHENIIKCITDLYSGSASKDDMEVYAQEAVYDGKHLPMLSSLSANSTKNQKWL